MAYVSCREAAMGFYNASHALESAPCAGKAFCKFLYAPQIGKGLYGCAHQRQVPLVRAAVESLPDLRGI